VTAEFVIVTRDFGNTAEVGHHRLKQTVTLRRNCRSRSAERAVKNKNASDPSQAVVSQWHGWEHFAQKVDDYCDFCGSS